MKKNKGFSLVELIVTIAIMAIVLTVAGVSIAVIASQRVSSAASDIKSQLQVAQTISMSKDNCYVELSVNSDEEVVIKSYLSNEKQFDKQVFPKAISVTAVVGTREYKVEENNTVRLSFVRESGAFSPCKVNGVGGDDDYCTKLIISNGKKSVTITLSKLTGKVSYE